MVWRRTPAQDAAVVVRGRRNRSSTEKVNACWELPPWWVRKSMLWAFVMSDKDFLLLWY
jgi:hypothetical protein